MVGSFSSELNIFPERISIRIIDPFTIKPLDVKTIMDHTRATRGRIITVEDHYYEGGSLISVRIIQLIKEFKSFFLIRKQLL